VLGGGDLVVMLLDLDAILAIAPSISERMSCTESCGGTGK